LLQLIKNLNVRYITENEAFSLLMDMNLFFQLLDSYGVTINNLHSSHQKVTIKKNIVDMAKEWPLYFSRIFPVSVSYMTCYSCTGLEDNLLSLHSNLLYPGTVNIWLLQVFIWLVVCSFFLFLFLCSFLLCFFLSLPPS